VEQYGNNRTLWLINRPSAAASWRGNVILSVAIDVVPRVALVCARILFWILLRACLYHELVEEGGPLGVNTGINVWLSWCS